MRFPRFTLRDMVEAQRRLLAEVLHIERLAAVIGASMGGMQALLWGVSHPTAMQRLVAMTPMARTASWAAMVVRAARACLMADPAWTGDGFREVPARGWRAYTAVMTALLSRTPAAVAEFAPDLQAVGEWFEKLVTHNQTVGFDAHDYLYQSWAYEAHDVGSLRGGNTAAALGSIRVPTMILAPPLDLFNPSESARWAAQQIPGAQFVEIPSVQGHQAATATRPEDAAYLNRVIRASLQQ
jgi:homoserine O-acetyltransferase